MYYIFINNHALQKTLKTVEASEKRKTLLKILEERKARKREAPLFETDPPRREMTFLTVRTKMMEELYLKKHMRICKENTDT